MFKCLLRPAIVCNVCQKPLQGFKETKVFQRSYSFMDKFDPPYLESLKPEVPEYPPVNVQIKGYDFAVLENYQSLIHRIAKALEVDVEDCWATPATFAHIKRFKPNSSNIDCEYTLPTYERNTQVVDVPSTKMIVFAEMIQAALPQGVTLSIHEHQPEHDEIRYVPDYELNQLKTQLDAARQKKL